MFKRIFTILVFAFCSVMAQDKLYSNEFALGDVTLLDGPFKKAQDLNVTVLLKYNLQHLLYSFRKDAGLPTPGFSSDYANWDGLNGHIGGHYLSALSMQYAATGNAMCKLKLDTMVRELKKCQDANGSADPTNYTGYICGLFGGKTIWTAIKGGNPGAINNGWAPTYNIHKIFAGLRDAWLYGNNDTARTVFLKLCDWGISCWGGLSDNDIQTFLGSEHGSINEMYADAYQMTNETKYLNMAKKLTHTWLFNPMVAGNDILDNTHANTQCAKVVGFQRTGEVANDSNYFKAANFFWTTVTTKRCVAIGGNSEDEWFKTTADCIKYLTDRDGPETCNSYNMLKITEGLFRQKPNAKYTDFYERTLFDHILSTQDPVTGGYCYFTSTHPQHYRVYSAPDVAMWCCVGTGMENHTKYGQYIYTHSTANDSLFVNLFIASQLNWKAKGVTVKQETIFPDEEQTKLTITVTSPTAFKMYIRHPYWAQTGEFKVIVGTDTLGKTSAPTSYVEVNRTWNTGDIVTVLMPMHFSYEQLPNISGWYALKRGPIVLAAKTDSTVSNMPGMIADDSRMGQVPSGNLIDYTTSPKLSLNTVYIDAQFQPVAGQPFTYKAPGIFQNKADTNKVLRPFFRTHRVRYMMYWNVSTYTGVADNMQQKTQEAGPQINMLKGAIKFTFNSADPSRHVVLYTLSGQRVADFPAYTQSATLNYSRQGIIIKNGMYAVQVKSRENTISKEVFITK